MAMHDSILRYNRYIYIVYISPKISYCRFTAYVNPNWLNIA